MLKCQINLTKFD